MAAGFCLSGVVLSAQNPFAAGDSLHRRYRFQEAIDQYQAASAQVQTLTELRALDDRIAQSQNALNMSDFCADPHVVARARFSRKDFFLFYPLKNQGWHPSPNMLDSLEGMPTYLPKGASSVYFSAADAGGSRNLYVSDDLDSLWSAPRLVGEAVLSAGNEIFPQVSPDGTTLYFASDALHGMGGFDLYRSTWDESTRSWGEPENMGFPYSSPADDFLLMDTDDGKYTLFASNRACSRDSVYVYVLEYESFPRHYPIPDPEALARHCQLRPVNDPFRIDNASAVSEEVPGNADTRLYMQKTSESRALRDSIYLVERELDLLRMQLSQASEDELSALSGQIRDKEKSLQPLQNRLSDTQNAIRRIEQSFLQNGVVSNSGREDREVVGASSGYTFSKHAMGGKLKLKMLPPATVPEPDFRIMPVGRFATELTLPDGIVYQIQLFSASRHASLDDLCGLAPVYERLTSSLRYTYSVGVFYSYDQALSHLNEVRRLGFQEASIVAYRNSRFIPLNAARRME